MDYYEILQVHPSSDEAEITKAYRRLALVYHPDKNKSADARLKFEQISDAYRLLLDPTARSAFDKVRRVRQEAVVRAKQMDDRRAYLKQDLLQREEQYAKQRQQVEQREAEKALQVQIARLQAEAALRAKREAEASGELVCSEEERTCRFYLMPGTDHRLLLNRFPTAQFTLNKQGTGGTLLFADRESAMAACGVNLEGVIVELVVKRQDPIVDTISTQETPTRYDEMGEEELREFTIQRLRSMKKP